MKTRLKADGRFWLTLDGKNFLGRGRVELLQRIRETGSISKAAKAMKMSYKAAWDAVDAMNTAWQSPLADSVKVGYQNIRVYFKIDADILEAQKEELVKMAQKYSPVFNTVFNQTPVSVQLDH